MTASYSPQEILPNAFPGISEADAQELVASSVVHTYPAGTVLCHENALEDIFYILLEGEVQVSKVINKTESRILKNLRAGDFFGEMALIHNAPRAATVTANDDVTVMEIHKDAFERMLQHSGSVSKAMVREISQRLRENDALAVEDLRLRANELARAYQKLAEQEFARREFVTNVAHELRTPLMAAGGFLQLLQKGVIPPDQVSTTIETVARNIQQITMLVNDILFLQEMDLILPKFQAVDIAPIVDSITERYRDKAALDGINLQLTTAPFLPSVSGDPKSLERAITAIVDNAVKFSPTNSVVTISTRQSGGQVIIEVTDQGPGIEPERLAVIFDRFSHTENNGNKLNSGLGLGLAITRQVIEQHHGRLDVQSEVGKGTTFTIRLNALRVAI